jgi:hypothetical protein
MKVNGRTKRWVYGAAAVALLVSAVSTAHAMGKRSTASAAPAPASTVTVWISSLESRDGKLILKADPIDWYFGKDADRIFAERDPEGAKQIGGAPDGYYIVDDDKTLTTFEISPDAEVLMQLYHPDAIQWNEKISLAQFEQALNGKTGSGQSALPYHLTVEDGKIVKIVQQYIP